MPRGMMTKLMPNNKAHLFIIIGFYERRSQEHISTTKQTARKGVDEPIGIIKERLGRLGHPKFLRGRNHHSV